MTKKFILLTSLLVLAACNNQKELDATSGATWVSEFYYQGENYFKNIR
jgi:hypothetical protein